MSSEMDELVGEFLVESYEHLDRLDQDLLVLEQTPSLAHVAENLLGQLRDGELTGASQRLNVITTELQEGVMKTRMQPIGNVWSKLPRVVREARTDAGKPAEGCLSLRAFHAGVPPEQRDDTAFEKPPEPLHGVARELILGACKLDDRLLLILDADKAVRVPAAV